MPACRYLGPSHLDVSVVASAWSLRKTPEKYCPSAIGCESRTLRVYRGVHFACLLRMSYEKMTVRLRTRGARAVPERRVAERLTSDHSIGSAPDRTKAHARHRAA
ncbi:hypothetical protein BURMUCGD1_6453 [Burkholderia multivorans CGD1]|nr:hypothetical protein BURMUCGD1_6453 [Burkholderia multivorans CGD1]